MSKKIIGILLLGMLIFGCTTNPANEDEQAHIIPRVIVGLDSRGYNIEHNVTACYATDNEVWRCKFTMPDGSYQYHNVGFQFSYDGSYYYVFSDCIKPWTGWICNETIDMVENESSEGQCKAGEFC